MQGQAFFQQQLRESLEALAAPADVQRDILRAMGPPIRPDELALMFDDVVGRTPEAVADGVLSEAAAQAIDAVDKLLTSMSGMARAHLWSMEALTTESVWARVRELAAEAVRLLPPAHGDAAPDLPRR